MLLESVWFFLWGLLWAAYFVTDGFDLGIGILLPFLGKDDKQRRTMFGVMGPMWDGNEVWLIAAGGVTFAAFPLVYATMFSSLYSALMLLLFGLIVRGVSFEFRNKSQSRVWRGIWDSCMFLGSLLAAVLLGATFANIFRGLPIDGEGVYRGSFLTLLNPYGLLGGAFFVLVFLVHGALMVAIKSTGVLHERSLRVAGKLWYALASAAVAFLVATWFSTDLYDNYLGNPALFALPLLALLGLWGAKSSLASRKLWKAWFMSAVTILVVTFFGIVGLYPRMFPSTIDPSYTLTAHNASSSPLTLKIMLVVVIIFLPIVLAYQIWAYRLFKGKITDEDLASEEHY